MKNMSGIYVASITPFTADDQINTTALETLMNRNLSEGAAGFFIGGSSAECFLLSHEERIRIFEIAAGFQKRTSLIAHIGSLSTKEAISFGLAARDMGYESISATPPFYYGYNSRDICSYYYDIARAVGMPVIVYNFPGNTKVDFNLADPNYRELFTSSAIAGVKHTNQVVYQLERFRELNPSLKIFNGFDETMIAGMALGADGSIGSTFNCMLPHYLKVYHAFLAGDIQGAQKLQHKANNIMEALCHAGLIPAVKYVLNRQGIEAGEPRRPFRPLSPEAGAYLDRILEENLVC